ncbi:MAG: T9SS type A sorting domain-containing protein [Candidatus Cloacimonetes bacterium]|nr:T9SS type A sorting domain-containing protein [Candidatus Cloacimonadota bacterium]MCA9784934.1 T9SS type A sorting domain-containing protein [Candidatus Cloacimonadota bacterium]
MRAFHFLATLLLLAASCFANLLPLGTWGGEGTRTAIDVQGEHIRNAGRWLERWNIGLEDPELSDRLLLDSAPVDLMEWDGVLLVLREDGVLEGRSLQQAWDPALWTLPLAECSTELLRRDNWLLPVSSQMSLLDLTNPFQPVVALEHINGSGSEFFGFGGHHACFVGDTLFADYQDGCDGGFGWEGPMTGNAGIAFDESGPSGNAWFLPGFLYSDWTNTDWVAYEGMVGVADNGQVSLYDRVTGVRRAVVHAGNSQVRLAVADTLLLASSSDTLSVFAWQEDPTPGLVIRAQLSISGGEDLRVTGTELLVTGSDQTAWVSLDSPEQPVVTRVLPSMGRITGIAKAAECLLVRQSSLHVLQLEPDGLVDVATLDLPPGSGLLGEGPLAVAQSGDSLYVILLENPEQLAVVSTIPAPARTALCLDGSILAYTTEQEVVVISLQDPAAPEEVFRTVADAAQLVGAGGVLAWVESGDHIQLVDARAPGAVVLADTLAWNATSRQLNVCAGRLIRTSVHPNAPYQDAWQEIFTLDDPADPFLSFTRVRGWQTESVQAGPDRLLVTTELPVQLGPIFELCVIEADDGLDISASWDTFLPWEGEATLLADAWIAVHEGSDGIRLLLDDSILASEPSLLTRPTGMDLAAAPNPFNPSTRLSVRLERAGMSRLSVHDILGREVAVLHEGPLSAGEHALTFDGSGLASGLYLLTLEQGGTSRTLRLLLLK